jgi:transcriptional regulator with XRE-family HTH domain
VFAENLKRRREAAGFTQASFAGAVGVPLRTVHNWEQGRRKPRVPMMLRVVGILGVTVDDLLAGESAAPAPKRARGRKGK